MHIQSKALHVAEQSSNLLNDAETEEREDAAKVEAKRVKLQKGLARLHSVQTPAL